VRNVVPFKAPEAFDRFGIDWTREAITERERAMREAYLTYESSYGPDGLVSLLLLAAVSRRRDAVATDLQAAADRAETLLAVKLHNHRTAAIDAVAAHVSGDGAMWM
jgi:hypothetical protein